MHSLVHVQTCLDVVLGNTLLLELFSCSSLRIGNGLVFLRNPTPLSRSFLLLISLLLHVLTKHSCDRFYCLLESNLTIVPCRKLIFIKLRLSPCSGRLPFIGESSLVLRNIISIFLSLRMLWKRGLEVRSIHKHISCIIGS